MRPVVIGRKYWINSTHGEKVKVIVKEADVNNTSSIHLIKVEFESNGMLLHVKRMNLHDIAFLDTDWGKFVRDVGIGTVGGIISLALQFAWQHFFSK